MYKVSVCYIYIYVFFCLFVDVFKNMIVLYIMIVNGGYIFWFVWGSCLKLCGSGMKF